jgi:hypothetical protein
MLDIINKHIANSYIIVKFVNENAQAQGSQPLTPTQNDVQGSQPLTRLTAAHKHKAHRPLMMFRRSLLLSMMSPSMPSSKHFLITRKPARESAHS